MSVPAPIFMWRSQCLTPHGVIQQMVAGPSKELGNGSMSHHEGVIRRGLEDESMYETAHYRVCSAQAIRRRDILSSSYSSNHFNLTCIPLGLSLLQKEHSMAFVDLHLMGNLVLQVFLLLQERTSCKLSQRVPSRGGAQLLICIVHNSYANDHYPAVATSVKTSKLLYLLSYQAD
jgi:hypothetical protein